MFVAAVFSMLAISSARAETPAVLCIDKPFVRDLRTLRDIPSNELCRDLRPGETREVVTQDRRHEYHLRKTGPRSYEAVLKLQFRVSSGPGTWTAEKYAESIRANEVANTEMNRRVRGCLAESNRYLRGPNGETLTMKLEDPDPQPELLIEVTTNELIARDARGRRTRLPAEMAQNQADYLRQFKAGSRIFTLRDEPTDKRKRKRTTTIYLNKENKRANSLEWNPNDIDCATITHELLHHLGLLDEYEERVTGYFTDPATGEVVKPLPYDPTAIGAGTGTSTTTSSGPGPSGSPAPIFHNAYSCRTLAPETSVMNDQRAALEAAKNGVFVGTLWGCSCPESNPNCLSRYSREDLEAKGRQHVCPPEAHAHDQPWSGDRKEDRVDVIQTGMMHTQVKRQKSRGTLLYPAHFRAIVFAGCWEKNATYYSCTAEAYTDKCIARDPKCESGTDSWLQ